VSYRLPLRIQRASILGEADIYAIREQRIMFNGALTDFNESTSLPFSNSPPQFHRNPS